MAWRRPDDKPWCEPLVVSLLTHICVTRPQWVNSCITTGIALDNGPVSNIVEPLSKQREHNYMTYVSDISQALLLSFRHSNAWWRHQLETFSVLLAICAGNSPGTGEFLSQRPVARGFGVFFDLRFNKRLSKQSRRRWLETPSRSLWRHCNGATSHQVIICYKAIWCKVSVDFYFSEWYVCSSSDMPSPLSHWLHLSIKSEILVKKVVFLMIHHIHSMS